jgi:UDP-N-acetylglucosamine acyltransferase
MMANRIHPTAVVGPGVQLGDGNIVGPYTVIYGPCRIGDGNWIGPHVSIGGPAEFLHAPHPAGWVDEPAGAGVIVGDRSRIREFVTINQGVHEATQVGDACYLMGRSHLGHDAVIGDDVVLASAVQLAGHVRVGDWANLGLGTVVHQRTRIGPGAMVGMGSAVRRDAPPFSITVGNPARTTGVNRIGLIRLGCSEAAVDEMVEHLAGRRDLPADLPTAIRDVLVAWAKDATDTAETTPSATGDT